MTIIKREFFYNKRRNFTVYETLFSNLKKPIVMTFIEVVPFHDKRRILTFLERHPVYVIGMES
jgi:hypothetical protein